MTTTESVQQAMADARRLWDERRRNIGLIRRVLGVSETYLADQMGLSSRQLVNQKLAGKGVIRPGELEGFAAALGVPTEVFDWETADVLKWLAENREQQIRSRCSELVAA